MVALQGIAVQMAVINWPDSYLLLNIRNKGYNSANHMRRLLAPLLALLVPGLLALMFFVKVEIPWEEVNVFWMMGFVFHIPLLLFFIAAIMIEISALREKKDIPP